MKDCLDNQVKTLLDIPYFDSDFWPTIIEESIEKLDQEERRLQEVEVTQIMEDENFDDSIESEDPTEISGKRKSASTYENKNSKKTTNQQELAKTQMSNCTDLLSMIFSTMEKHKEEFFVIRLHNQITSCPAMNCTDTLIQCDLMDTRNIFLKFARNKNYGFSSLRYAKFSSIGLLYDLHASTTQKLTYNYNRCQQKCDICHYCTVWEDFDQYEKFSNKELKHNDEQNPLNNNDKFITSTSLRRQTSMQRSMDALLHALNCCTVNCVNHSCFRYKHVIQHTKDCKEKNRQCNVCKQVIFLYWYHAKICMNRNCEIPYCTSLKFIIEKQWTTNLQADRPLMEAMMMQQETNIMLTQT
ncbi:unnamed protein product [Rotaria sordida]|uniref:histone acetyltransferase n=1 Tax=Rotaria sordida TaxID=392033 RepID=A0A814LHN5_9BILA|nr:unnamed protein product [Rotaria sordida]CAF3662623.1 unnamed protein product [Rotaria sordida]